MQPWPALKHPTPALPSRCPWALRIMVVPGEDVELGGQWRARHRWTANDLSFATVPLAASSVGFETLYEAIRKSRIVSAFPGGSPVTGRPRRGGREAVEGGGRPGEAQWKAMHGQPRMSLWVPSPAVAANQRTS